MKKIILIISLVMLVFIFIRGIRSDDSGATIGKPSSDTMSDGRELFPLHSQVEVQDFIAGGMYLVRSGNTMQEFRFVRYENGAPFFVNPQGQEEAFSNNVLLSVSSDVDMEEVESFLKGDRDVLEYDILSLVRTVSVSFESPYTAYLKHLEYGELDLFTSVGLDFTVSTMHNEDIGI